MAKSHPYRDRLEQLVQRLGGPSILLLLVWPLFILVVNPNWIYFNDTGFVDAWIYVGHFLHLQEYLQLYSDEQFYYLTRLSWILPGFIIYHVFPPLVANIVLRIFVYYLTIFSVYGALNLMQHRAALLISILLGGYSYFLLAAGWDYVDGIGIGYFCLSVFLLFKSMVNRRSIYLLLAGASCALMVSANIFTTVLMPGMGIAYLIAQKPIKRTLADSLIAFVGFACMVFALGGINMVLGGEFWYFRRSFVFATYVSNIPRNLWVEPNTDWPIRFGFLVIPQIVFFAGLISITLKRTRDYLAKIPYGFSCIALHLVSSAIMVVFQMRPSTPILSVPFYASYLIGTTFFCLAPLLVLGLEKVQRYQFRVLLTVAIGIMLVSQYTNLCKGVFQVESVYALLIGCVWIIFLVFSPTQAWNIAVLIAILGLITPRAYSLAASSFSLASSVDACRTMNPIAHKPINTYLATFEGERIIHEFAPGKRLYFWYDADESAIYRNIAAMHMFSWNLISEEFPNIKSLPKEATIALLSQDPNVLGQATRVLQARNRATKLIGQQTIIQGENAFQIYVFESHLVRQTFKLGQILRLEPNSLDAEQVLEDGWSLQESFGAWTVGKTAQMTLDLHERRDFLLEAHITASARQLSANISPMKVTVLANGRELTQWEFNDTQSAGIYTVLIPAKLIDAQNRVHFTLRIDAPRLPSADPRNLDRRELGVAIDTLTIRFAVLNP